jgi:serine/threonine-protein kinase
MENVEGESIDKFLSLNPDSFDSVFRQTIAAFCHLEQNRILHRDLRYTNILVRNDGVVKVIDLGFGKEVKKNSDFNKSVTLNWAFTPPDDFFQQTYDFRTEIYFLGKLFLSIMMQESIAHKEILSVLRKMCVDDPGTRIATFAEVRQALDKSVLADPEFSEEEVAAYREFADNVVEVLSQIEISASYLSDPPTVLGKLEKVYESCLLESSTDCRSVLRCLIDGSYISRSLNPFWVEHIRNFIRLLKSRDEEGQRIILANLMRRLDKIQRYDESEIPF